MIICIFIIKHIIVDKNKTRFFANPEERHKELGLGADFDEVERRVAVRGAGGLRRSLQLRIALYSCNLRNLAVKYYINIKTQLHVMCTLQCHVIAL